MDHKQRIEVTDGGPAQVLEDLREHYISCSHSQPVIYGKACDPTPCPRCSLHRVAQSARELNARAERAKALGITTREITSVLLAVLAEDVT
jgi:hypothetical protein